MLQAWQIYPIFCFPWNEQHWKNSKYIFWSSEMMARIELCFPCKFHKKMLPFNWIIGTSFLDLCELFSYWLSWYDLFFIWYCLSQTTIFFGGIFSVWTTRYWLSFLKIKIYIQGFSNVVQSSENRIPDVQKRAMEDVENVINFYQNSDVINGKSIKSCLCSKKFKPIWCSRELFIHEFSHVSMFQQEHT
jgi:hypothetical protein